jgi:Abnormal spindle-like microcephaly-assoc'd, ASPM-SPD-2-Hydin
VRRFYFSSRLVSVLFLNIFLCANIATGQVSFNPTSLSFGSVQAGNSVSQTLIMSNIGKSDLTISRIAMVGQGFSLRTPNLPLTLSAGQNVALNVAFTPVSSGSASANLSVVSSVTSNHDRSGKHQSMTTTSSLIPLSGTGTSPSPIATPGVLAANPGALVFAAAQTGGKQTQWEMLTNTGGSAVTISQATTGGSFTLTGLNLPTTLAPNQSVTFQVTFAPLTAGSASGNLLVNSDASNPSLTISLAGTGTSPGQLSLAPSFADFGNVTVGSPKIQSGSLVASGSSVTISSVSMSDSEFSLAGIALPVTIAAGQSVPFTLTFIPQASGTATATLSFISNAVNSTAASLTGIGIAPPLHSVNLFWDTTSEVVGYDIYRGNQSGGPYVKINPVLTSGTSYTDNSVQAGQNYYYVTTAVDSAGTQSKFSNETHAGIPTP